MENKHSEQVKNPRDLDLTPSVDAPSFGYHSTSSSSSTSVAYQAYSYASLVGNQQVASAIIKSKDGTFSCPMIVTDITQDAQEPSIKIHHLSTENWPIPPDYSVEYHVDVTWIETGTCTSDNAKVPE